MDFFAQQEAARRQTTRLLVAFVLAVAATIAAVYLPARLLLLVLEEEERALWNPALFVAVAAVMLAVVLLGTLYRIATLRQGGQVVARLLGGRPVEPNTADADERRLLNIVDEMAIAAGMPAPPVWVLRQEQGINAFAAGFGPEDAVVGVTAGAMRLLTRDELQGVVAHEFSHILSGDMRRNLRLMGWLHGLLLLALIGRELAFWGGRGSGDDRKAGLALVAFGVALLVIGSIGVVFGRLIKSGVSRQREYLADAAAVQFTRYPPGLAGALKKIGGLAAGSRLATPKAEQASHMFFGNGLGGGLGLFATHPPLAERIRRLDPNFDGTFPKVETPPAPAPSRRPRPAARAVAAAGPATLAAIAPDTVAAQAGQLVGEHLRYAAGLLARLPEDLRSRLREPTTAQGILFALLAARDPATRERQRLGLRERVEPYLVDEMERLEPTVTACPDEARLPLVDLAVPALTRLSPPQYRRFRQAVQLLAEADRETSLFEFTLGWILLRHLGPRFGERQPGAVETYSLRMLGPECATLFSALAHYGTGEPGAAERAFAEAVAQLAPEPVVAALVAAGRSDLDAVAEALRKLALVAPRLKRKLVRAAAAAIATDRQVTVRESELLRAVCEALECPLPPFLDGGERGGIPPSGSMGGSK